MGGMISTFLTLVALAAAAVAVVWLRKMSNHVSDLGRRILESEDIEKIIKASERTMTFESRMTEHETKLEELVSNGGKVAQVVDKHTADLSAASEKSASFEQTTNKNGADIAENKERIKALTDEIQRLKEFQAATEKARGVILATFNDMQVAPSEDSPMIVPQEPNPEETSQEPEFGLGVPQAAESGETSEGSQEGQESQEEAERERVFEVL